MARRATAHPRQSFFVEHYRPGLSTEALSRCAGLVRDAVKELEGEGKPIHFRRWLIVPGDESLLCMLEADSEQLVRQAYARAELTFDRISAAVAEEG
jgi:hypothetical protein